MSSEIVEAIERLGESHPMASLAFSHDFDRIIILIESIAASLEKIANPPIVIDMAETEIELPRYREE